MGTGVSPRRIATGNLVTNFLITKQYNQFPYLFLFLRKEVIQPHLPIRLPCYDFTPVTSPAFGSSLLSVESLTSGITDSHGVTGGVYKTRERMPAFTGFYDTLAPSGTSLGYMFPALFVTIACGAVSGFHSLVGSGTTSKQLDQEKDAKPIAYGGMLIECALALISVCAVGYIWNQYADGTTTTPTVVFATGLASMFSKVFGSGCYNVVYSMLILAVSAFCLTSVDTATRLARYMFAEFFVEPGKTREDLTGWKRVITNPYVATGITVVAGVALGLTGYAKIWALFGAANQLLAALGLLAVCCWLGKVGRNNKMFYFPMFFMLIVTLTSLVFTIKAQVVGIMAGGEGVVWCYVRGIIGVLLVILAIDLVVEGIRALGRNKKAAQAAE